MNHFSGKTPDTCDLDQDENNTCKHNYSWSNFGSVRNSRAQSRGPDVQTHAYSRIFQLLRHYCKQVNSAPESKRALCFANTAYGLREMDRGPIYEDKNHVLS